MAMVLFYERINWENFPSVVTPINEINLNKVDYAVKTLDERTVELYNKKAERSVVLNTIKDWSLDEKTGIITITKVNGDVVKFDLNIEKIPVNFELSEDGILTMTTDDGSVFTADIGAMIPVDVFENSDTISVSYETRIEVASNFEEYSQSFVSPYSGKLYITANDDYSGDVAPTYIITVFLTLYAEEGVTPVTERRVFHLSAGEMVETEVEFVSTLQIYGSVKTLEIPNTSGESKKRHYYFSVKDGSIKEKHLEPNYLSDIKVQAENAELSVTASAESAKEAAKSAEEAKGYAEQAKEVIFPVSDVSLNRQTLGYVKKNLLKLDSTTLTSAGVTFNASSDDGTVIANGSNTGGDGWFVQKTKLHLKAGTYILTGCPSGARVDGTTYFRHSIGLKDADGVGQGVFSEYGDGVKFNITQEMVDSGWYYTYSIGIFNNYTAENLTFYPMLRGSDIEDDTFEPYVDDVDTRLKNAEKGNIYKYGVKGDGVTDDTEAIQNFINDNTGNVLFFPEGTYRIANNIKIPSDTTLIGYGATILFEANNAMINASDGTIGGTVANKNINIVGFTFIANTTQNATSVAFGHANNCKVIDCTFSNNAGWHMIEINSCDNVEIKSCVFKEYGILRDGTVSSGTKTEMVQVDYAYGASGFPWFGPYDRTPCTNVYIDKCSFYGDINARCAAVGNHAYEDGDVEVIKNVYITDCYVCDSSSLLKYVVGNNFFVDHCIAENMNYGVYGSSYTKDAYITNNIFIGDNGESGGYGIAYSTSDISKEADCMKNINVKNNVVEYFGYLGIKVDGYNNIIENNVIKNNGDSGILVGQNNYNTIIKGNVIENNNSRDVRLNALDSVLYGIIGGITLRDNKIESLISWCGVTPNTTSYMVNNIIDTSASTSGYSGLVRTNNIVGGVLES